jgi:1-acyl-sn-glycerol-3-phosphate acyltransferase
MVTWIRSIVFLIFYLSGSVGLVLIALFESRMGRIRVTRASRRWARWHRFCAKYLLGITTKVEGVLPQGAAIVALKHESNFETIELLVLFDRPAVVMKKELTDLPVWGQIALAHGVIPVDRQTGAAALRLMLKAAKAAVAEDRPIVIFPEGTRIVPGESPALKPGLAGLYKSLSLPVIPVALQSGRLWPRKGIRRYPGVVTLKVGEPIPPGLPREEMEARVHAAINIYNLPAPVA